MDKSKLSKKKISIIVIILILIPILLWYANGKISMEFVSNNVEIFDTAPKLIDEEIIIEDSIYEEFRESLREEGINLEGYYLDEKYDYLERMVQAQLVTSYPDITNKYSSGGYEYDPDIYPPYNPSSSSVIRYYQQDYAHISYGYGTTLASAGCGPTSFAMVATHLTGRQITPADIVAWCGLTYRVQGQGTSWAFFPAASRQYGLSCRATTSWSEIESALRNGQLVISSQSSGLFTNGGHFILLVEIDENNKVYVNDPNKYNAINKGYNERAFTKNEINGTSKQYWIFE